MLRVGVLRGGPSNEYEVSLATGASVLSALQNQLSEKYTPVDILITRDGVWNMQGKEIKPQDLMQRVDVLWNALHGFYGEDGQVQQLLESLQIPYTGSGPLASALGMNKKFSKTYGAIDGIKTPHDYVVRDMREVAPTTDPSVYLKEEVQKIFLKLSPPWVVKPLSGGSSLGVSIVKTQSELLDALTILGEYPGDILVEEYLFGKEATVSVLDDYRGEKIYSALPIEIRTPKDRFFDYEMKYGGEAQEISPGNFSAEEKNTLQEAAKIIHRALGLRHYSRSDFIVTPRGVYFLEVNTHPGLTNQSLLPKALAPLGIEFHEFIEHILNLALQKK